MDYRLSRMRRARAAAAPIISSRPNSSNESDAGRADALRSAAFTQGCAPRLARRARLLYDVGDFLTSDFNYGNNSIWGELGCMSTNRILGNGSRKRLGKSGEDIFVPPPESSDAERPKKRGRRPSHTEHWTKVTVVLFDRQIVFLDRLGADIRAASGVAISRAHVIRALIDALSESDLDLTGTRSEADLRAILTARLGRYRV